MKTKHVWAAALLALGIFSTNAQNVSSTSTLTSGGLQAGTLGTGNTFYGYQSGGLTSSMYGTNINSTFIGHQAGRASFGQNNTFLGYRAGYSTIDGSNNILIGTLSGYNVTDNSNNILIGNGAGYSAEASGNIMIGNNAGYLASYGGNIFIGNNAGYNEGSGNKLYIENSNSTTPLIYGDFSANKLVFNGKVGITNETLANQANLFPTTAGGVNVSGYQLFVKGGILTEELRIVVKNTTNWADYVFEEDYTLRPLSEVECFIKENGHLPNMPSATQIAEEGIQVADMAKMQQEKIEELTLYIIEQDKKLEQQQKEIDELKAMVQQLLNDKK